MSRQVIGRNARADSYPSKIRLRLRTVQVGPSTSLEQPRCHAGGASRVTQIGRACPRHPERSPEREIVGRVDLDPRQIGHVDGRAHRARGDELAVDIFVVEIGATRRGAASSASNTSAPASASSASRCRCFRRNELRRVELLAEGHDAIPSADDLHLFVAEIVALARPPPEIGASSLRACAREHRDERERRHPA